MALLELVGTPDWMGALGVALTRPPGVPERARGEDPWKPTGRTRGAPAAHLRRPRVAAPGDGRARALHSPCPARRRSPRGRPTSDAQARLDRLRDRRVLDAAGFLLHD